MQKHCPALPHSDSDKVTICLASALGLHSHPYSASVRDEGICPEECDISGMASDLHPTELITKVNIEVVSVWLPPALAIMSSVGKHLQMSKAATDSQVPRLADQCEMKLKALDSQSGGSAACTTKLQVDLNQMPQSPVDSQEHRINSINCRSGKYLVLAPFVPGGCRFPGP